MRNLLIFISFIFFQCSFIFGQYVVKSENILNPDLNIDYVRNNVEFWKKNAYDATYGGFYSSVSRNGAILNTNQKSLISQTRQGYGFTRAFMLTGDETYLIYAKSALDFLFNHGWDVTNDGWYCFAQRNGSLDNRPGGWNPNAGKWGFQQHYALVGILANYEATHDETVKSWMDKGINSLYTHMWDSRPGFEGYYSDGSDNWSAKSGKGFTPTVDGITTNAELTYLITKNPIHKERLLKMADIIVNRFIPQMNDSRVKVLYPEEYSSDWVPNYNTSESSIGHFIKTAWSLGRAYLCDTTRKETKVAACKILDEAWTYQNGAVSTWDHVNGGPFNCLNILTGNWGSFGDNKDYWTLEQGFTASMINYYITKNPNYIQMADESLGFFMKHMVDSVNGEIFSELDPAGIFVRSDIKGDDFKACYHSVELGYYAYLYSSLYYLHRPASLYYKFTATTEAQNISLSPIPMEDGLLRIKSVTLDGNNFTNFDPLTRTLSIAANQGGKFKVTFESLTNTLTSVTSIDTDHITVFPNPTKGAITIDGMEETSHISIIDLTGKILLEKQTKGDNLLTINLQMFNPGIYFVVSHQKSGIKVIKKVIKL